jgi:UPF0755 protein
VTPVPGSDAAAQPPPPEEHLVRPEQDEPSAATDPDGAVAEPAPLEPGAHMPVEHGFEPPAVDSAHPGPADPLPDEGAAPGAVPAAPWPPEAELDQLEPEPFPADADPLPPEPPPHDHDHDDEHEHEPLERAGAEHPPADDPEQAESGFAVPGLRAAAPPPPRQGLPEPPPPLRRQTRAPMRRAFRRDPATPLAAVAPGRARTRRRGVAARLAALVALLAVAGAIVLAIHSLTRSSHKVATTAPAVVKVLIPEGETRVQIAQIAAAKGLKGSYRSAAHSSNLLNPVHYGAPSGTPDLEGFLFPATYELRPGAPASLLVREQLEAFQENFPAEDAARAKALGVTPYQLLTVASMIEREAQVPGDRAKIAAVIYNRLKAGMPLGIDATIYYAVEMQKGIATYTHELTESQLRINSPYNTRTHTGLPPTPISNPGAASIKAAAHPARVSYLYYVAAADGCGEQAFSTTQSAFEANVAAYEAAKRQNGGRPPSCKR